MKPTLQSGQIVIVNKISYGLILPFSDRYILSWNLPEKGDVVVLPHRTDTKIVVKRCIAKETERIPEELAVLYGVEATVPRGFVFVMGDNQIDSIDSRSYGLIPVDEILGKVIGY